VSDAPPTLLVCSQTRKRRGRADDARERRVLHQTRSAPDAEAIADMFAGRTGAQSEARFQLGAWGTLTTGAPVLTTAVVALDCRILEIKAVASHNVIFGAIEAIHMGPAGPALVYHDRPISGCEAGSVRCARRRAAYCRESSELRS